MKVRTIQPSGDVLLDLAVENALRAAKPFLSGGRTLEFTYSTRIFHKPQPQQTADDGGEAPKTE